MLSKLTTNLPLLIKLATTPVAVLLAAHGMLTPAMAAVLGSVTLGAAVMHAAQTLAPTVLEALKSSGGAPTKA